MGNGLTDDGGRRAVRRRRHFVVVVGAVAVSGVVYGVTALAWDDADYRRPPAERVAVPDTDPRIDRYREDGEAREAVNTCTPPTDQPYRIYHCAELYRVPDERP